MQKASLGSARNYLIWALIIACVFDIGTFLYAGLKFDLFAYEINPIILLWKDQIGLFLSIAFTILWKILINAGMIYLLWYYQPKKSHFFAYALVYGILFSIIIQVLGGAFNLYTASVISSIPEGTVVPPPMKEEAALALGKVISLIYYFFLLFSLLTFWVYEKIYRLIPKR